MICAASRRRVRRSRRVRSTRCGRVEGRSPSGRVADGRSSRRGGGSTGCIVHLRGRGRTERFPLRRQRNLRDGEEAHKVEALRGHAPVVATAHGDRARRLPMAEAHGDRHREAAATRDGQQQRGVPDAPRIEVDAAPGDQHARQHGPPAVDAVKSHPQSTRTAARRRGWQDHGADHHAVRVTDAAAPLTGRHRRRRARRSGRGRDEPSDNDGAHRRRGTAPADGTGSRDAHA